MIDVTTLPSVGVADARLLPECPGIYFVILDGEVIYVGKSKNLNARWKSHHRLYQARDIGATIAYLSVPEKDLAETEESLIEIFLPRWNLHGRKSENSKTRTLHTRLRQSTWDKLTELAESDGRTATGWLEWIIEREYSNLKKRRG